MPVFALPMALFGLAALPIAVGVYVLRSRSRRRLVSSLILWSDLKRARTSGIRIRNVQFPLILLVELLILALAALAAADPRVPMSESRTPLVVVLDDSFRMQAEDADGRSSRERAVEAVLDEIDTGRHFPVYLVAAGVRPRLVGQPIRDLNAAERVLAGWHCQSPRADIDRALTFGARTAPPGSRIIVVTDRAPDTPPEEGGLTWWAFGKPVDNLAIVGALRNQIDGRKRVLVEVANYSPGSRTVRMTVEGIPGEENSVMTQQIESGRTYQYFRDLPERTGNLVFTLDDDALDLDNRVELLDPPSRAIRTVLAVSDADALRAVQRAVQAHRNVNLVASGAQLLITDSPEDVVAGSDRWVLQLVLEKPDKVQPYSGPYVVDRAHVLADGLAPEGMVWAASTDELPGYPVLMVGDIPLITVQGSRPPHGVRLRCCLGLSSLTSSPNWPIVLSNMVDWRSRALPGLQQVNLRLGGAAALVLPRAVTSAELMVDNREPLALSTETPVLHIEADRLGVHRVVTDKGQFRFAVNALSAAGSDVRPCTTGRWGNWVTAELLRTEFKGVGWLLLIGVLALMALHQWMVLRSTRSDLS